MARVRFALQTVLVLALVMLVGWPEQRNLGAGARSRDGGLSRVADAEDVESYRVAGARTLIGYGSASEQRLGAGAASALLQKLYENDVEGRRRRSPAGVQALRGRINGIMGYVRGLRNQPIAFARLLLRDTQNGRVEARAIANESGRFAFIDVMPSRYIVELLNANGDVLATSEMIQIGIGDLRETIVSRAGRTTFASFGGGLAPSAPAAVDAAASQGVNRFTAPERCASPPCDSSNP